MHKIGLMGCGVVAEYGHLPPLRDSKDFELYALMDPDAARVEDYRQRFGVPHAYTTQDDFFSSGIEAAAICSPAPFHLDNIRGCAAHGIPALCEKPLAMNDQESRQMIEVMAAAGQPLYVGFCYRFSRCAQTIRRLVREGAIGEVKSLRLIYNWDCHGKYEQGPDGEWRIYERRADRMREGGPMVDCGVHQIDLAQWWLDSPIVRHTGHGAWVDEYDAPDHVWLHLDHESGAHTCVEISYTYGHTTKDKFNAFIYELIGTDGIIRYERNTDLFELRTHEGTTSLEHSGEKNFAKMYDAFALALKTGEAGGLCTAEQARAVTDIAHTATQSIIDGRIMPPQPASR